MYAHAAHMGLSMRPTRFNHPKAVSNGQVVSDSTSVGRSPEAVMLQALRARNTNAAPSQWSAHVTRKMAGSRTPERHVPHTACLA